MDEFLSKKPKVVVDLPTWSIYRAAPQVEWVGRVEATGQHEAIEKAAKLYRVPAAKLIAVFRGQPSGGS
jgi:hypothetical protein